MVLSRVKYIVLYRAYRSSSTEPLSYTLFGDVREAMSFAGTHSRYCSTMDTCKVDCELTDELLQAIVKGA
jgi:hypothetical protein